MLGVGWYKIVSTLELARPLKTPSGTTPLEAAVTLTRCSAKLAWLLLSPQTRRLLQTQVLPRTSVAVE
jgi:hypothetical protein